jgi:hypothetical protein
MKLRCSLYARPEIIRESSAPRRRLAAGGATQRLSDGAAVSLARLQVASLPSVMVAERRATRPQQHFRRPSGVVVPGCPMPTAPCSPCPRPRVQRPPVQRPGVRCVSSVRLSGVRASGVRVRCPCPASRARIRRRVSDVRCERPASVRVASVSARSASVRSWSARVQRAATRLGTGRVGVSSHRLQGSRCTEVRHRGRLRAGRQERAAGMRRS